MPKITILGGFSSKSFPPLLKGGIYRCAVQYPIYIGIVLSFNTEVPNNSVFKKSHKEDSNKSFFVTEFNLTTSIA